MAKLDDHLQKLKSQGVGQKAQFVKEISLTHAVLSLCAMDDTMWVGSRDGSIHIRDSISGVLYTKIGATQGDSKQENKV